MTLSDPSPTQPKSTWGFLPSLGFTLLIFLAYSIAQGLVLFLFYQSAHPSGPPEGFTFFLAHTERYGFMLAAATVVAAPIGILLTLAVARFRSGPTLYEYFGLYAVSARSMGLWLAGTLAVMMAAQALTFFFEEPATPEFMVRAWRTAGSPTLLGVALVIGAPLFEEILFRGLLLRGAMRSFSGGWAVFVASLPWALAHGQYEPYHMAQVFLLGLWFGYSYLRTGSLVPAILMHAFVNLLALVYTAWLSAQL